MLFLQFLGLASLTLIQASVKPFRSPKLNHIVISCLSIVSLQLATILSINRSSVHVVTYCTASLTLLLLLGFVSLICYQVLIKYSAFTCCQRKKLLKRYEDDEDYIETDEMRRALLLSDNSD